MFFDWATNTQLMKLIDTYIIGSGYFAFVIMCIIGMPIAWVTIEPWKEKDF